MRRQIRLVLLTAFASAWAPGAQAQTPPLVYSALQPCRIVDTRPGQGGTGALAANETRTFHVVGSTSNFAGQGGLAGGCGIPGYVGPTPQVQAVVFNFVAVAATGAGNLRAWPADQPVPNAAVLNYAKVSDLTFPGAPLNLANGIVIPVSQDAVEGNDLSIRADVSGTHVVVDVVGYFGPIGPGEVVMSLNGQTDDVTLSGTNGLSVSAGSGTVTVASNATSSNTADAIVSRDGSGNFAAGTITASLAGNAATATTTASFSGSLAGEVTGTQGATVVTNAVSANTADAIVRRDGTGGFSAGTVALSGNLTLPASSSTAGNLLRGGNRLLHTFGSDNVFLGLNAGNFTMTGFSNTASGSSALQNNTTGANNTAIGHFALRANTTGVNNTAVGRSAFGNNIAGSNNIGIGNFAGADVSNASPASDNIYVGHRGLSADSGTIRIGSVSQTRAFLAGVRSVTTGVANGLTVLIDSNGQLGTTSSSATVKRDIAGMAEQGSALMKLRPVSFFYRGDAVGIRQYGLIAEEVAEVMPELVQFSLGGEAETVRYHFLAPLLLNEIQKQQQTIEEQHETNEQQRKQITMLEARLVALEAQSRSRNSDRQ